MNVYQMEGVAHAIRFASMLLDHLLAAVYLDTSRMFTIALVRKSDIYIVTLRQCACNFAYYVCVVFISRLYWC